MTKRQLMIAAILVITFTAACQTHQSPSTSTTNDNRAASQSTPDQFAAVRGIYIKDCESCHGKTGQGGTVKQEDGSKLKVPTLREGPPARHDDNEFVKQITKGGDGMPAFADKLNAEQTNALIKMIRVEFQGK